MDQQSDIELNSILKTLVPISNLSKDSISAIAASANINSFAKDYIVFNEGDNDEYAYYLLEGELELLSTNNTNFHIVSGTDDARYPLAQFQPRQYTAKAITESTVLIINRTYLDSLLVGNEDSFSNDNGVEVNDLSSDEDDDWMSRILQSPLYINISVENIQKIFSVIESIDVKQGEVVINQGDEGDYYYIIQKGRCSITRKPTATAADIKLTELREGDAFGEESIIANLKRNASVTMLTDGRLMRLNKQNFKELILNPILHAIDYESAEALTSQGAIWLDVRYADEFQDYAIEESLNIPLNVLRLQVNTLDLSKQYIVCCDTASRSSIAAYILAQHGYDVLHLDKGLKDLLRHEDIQEKDNTSQVSEETESTNVVPFKNSKNLNDDHVTNSAFTDEITKLRQELGDIKRQFDELKNIKESTAELKKSIMLDAEKHFRSQNEQINLQTQSANKLIQHAQKMHKEIESEKRSIQEEVNKSRLEQEETMTNIQQSINARLLEEEKKMQEFYLWKETEIKKIRELKKAAENQYLAKKIENELKSNHNQLEEKISSNSENVSSDDTQIKDELREWVKQQVKNDLTPLNKEIQRAKRKLIEQANDRAEKAKQIEKVHDQALSSEINTLLKGVES